MAVRKLVVQLRLTGVRPTTRGLNEVADAAAKAASAWDRLMRAMRGAAGAQANFAAGAKRAAQGPGGGVGQQFRNFARGPRGGSGGRPGPGPNPRPQPSSADRAWEALLTTRIGGRFSPLIGRLLRIAKPDLKLGGAGVAESFGQLFSKAGLATGIGNLGKAAGGAGRALLAIATKHPALAIAAVAIVAAGAGALLLKKALIATSEAAAEAARRLSDFAAARLVSGGSNSTFAALGSMGFSPGEAAARARAFREYLASNPMAMAAGLSRGIGAQLPREFGGTDDEARLFLAGLVALRAEFEKSEAGARRLARQWDADDLLSRVAVSARQWRHQLRDAQRNAEIMSRGQQDAVDFQSALRSLLENFRLARVAFGAGAMRPLTIGMNLLSDALGRFAVFTSRNPAAARFLGSLAAGLLAAAAATVRFVTALAEVQAAFHRFLFGIYDFLRNAASKIGIALPDLGAGMNAAQAANTAALAANTAALNANTKGLMPGTYGKSGVGLPSKLSGLNLNNAAKSGAFALGYFNF